MLSSVQSTHSEGAQSLVVFQFGRIKLSRREGGGSLNCSSNNVTTGFECKI